MQDPGREDESPALSFREHAAWICGGARHGDVLQIGTRKVGAAEVSAGDIRAGQLSLG